MLNLRLSRYIIRIAAVLSVISGGLVSAAPVAQSRAEAVALNYCSENFSGPAKLIPGGTKMSKKAGQTAPLWYAVNTSERFVLVSGDDFTTPVLGYSDCGSFDESKLPPQMQWLLSNYEDQIASARSKGLTGDAQVGKEWKDLSSDPASFVPRRLGMEKKAAILPLLGTIAWDQGEGWNAKCPSDTDGPGRHCLTGCVATAMSQIMRYHQWPNQGVGTHSYTPAGYGTQTVNYGAATYDWESMPETEPSLESAKLLYHAGVSVEMMYGPDSSGAISADVPEAMRSHFQYESGELQTRGENETNASWNKKILTELQAKCPVYYAATDPVFGGHAFVVDGYDSADFHVNWGWSGSCNGYYSLDLLAPSGSDARFTENNRYIPGLMPKGGVTAGYTVSFNANGGTGTMTPQKFRSGVAQKLTLNTFTRTSYTFMGWNTAADGSGIGYSNGEKLSLEDNMTLFAQWKSNAELFGRLVISTGPDSLTGRGYTLTYGTTRVSGGGETADYELPIGTQYQIVFNKISEWREPATVTGVAVGGDIPVHGEYVLKVPVYTVIFNGNGATNGAIPMQTYRFDIPSTLSLNVFTRIGYEFTGWNTTVNGTGDAYTDCQVITISSNMTLYAQWKKVVAPLPTALDNSAVAWETSGNAEWFGQTAVFYYGGSAARSGAIGNGQSSVMSATVTGPGTLSFYRRVSSEAGCDFLRFLIDETVQDVVSGQDNAWAKKTYSIPAGAHTLKWEYSKNAGLSSGSDCAWVDKVVWNTDAGVELNCFGGNFTAGTVSPLSPEGRLDFQWYVSTTQPFDASQFWCEIMASKTGGFDMIRLGGTMTQSHVQKGLPGLSNILSPGTQLLNTVPDGRYTLVPCVNLPAHGISTFENNYADNWAPIAGKRLSVRNTAQPQVDLVLQDTVVVPNGPKNVTVSARVRNAGSGAMKGSGCWLEVFYGYLNAEGDIVPEGTIGPGQLVSGLDAGATMNCTLTGTVPSGVAAKALYVLADSTDIVPEPNKVNNSYLWYSPTVLPTGKNNGVDLEMTDLTVSSDQLAPTYQVKPGDKLNYSVTIRNNGVTLSTPVWLELFASQDGCGSRVRGASLTESEYLTMPEAGQSQMYQLSRTINSIGDGMYSVMAMVNRDGLAGNPGDMTPLNNRCKFSGGRISLATPTESGEVNLTWQGAPVFTYARTTGYMTVSGTVINTGTVTGRAFWVEPFIGHIESETGMFVRERPLTGGTCCAGLAPGETQEISLGGYAGPGKVIGILIDSTDLVAETDETDNYDYSELTY